MTNMNIYTSLLELDSELIEKAMKIPYDLKAYRTRKILVRVIPCTILVAAFATVLILWGEVIFDMEYKSFKDLCYVVVMLIPFIVTGVPHKLIDSTYYGTVKQIDIETTLDNSTPLTPVKCHLYWRNTIYLHIEKPNGKIVRKKAYSGMARLQQHIQTYHEGDSVFHLYGTPNVIVLPGAADSHVHCAVCGDSNDSDRSVCRSCGHSLIKMQRYT